MLSIWEKTPTHPSQNTCFLLETTDYDEIYIVFILFSFWPNSMEKLNRTCWAGDKSCPETVCVGNQFSSDKILWEISLWQNTVENFSSFPAENVLKNNCLPVDMTQIPLAFMGIYVFVMLQRPIIAIVQVIREDPSTLSRQMPDAVSVFFFSGNSTLLWRCVFFHLCLAVNGNLSDAN